MGNILFGVDISNIIRDATKGQLLSASLIKITQSAFDPNNPGGGTTTIRTEYSCEGFVDSYDDDNIDGTIVRISDRRVTLIANSVAGRVSPSVQDEIMIENKKYMIVNVARDPAIATYICQVR